MGQPILLLVVEFLVVIINERFKLDNVKLIWFPYLALLSGEKSFLSVIREKIGKKQVTIKQI